MNYLGHMYFSGNDTELMMANLYGDFIKGSHLEHLPEIVQQGIRLHRNIDFFIDNYPGVKELQKVLRPQLPKVSGIAIDIYFDHLLALNWNKFHPQELQSFLNYIYRQFKTTDNLYSEEYNSFIKAMIHYNWMSHYSSKEGLNKMCRGVSSKLSFPNELVNGAEVFNRHESVITDTFFEYMDAAREHFLVENHRILS